MKYISFFLLLCILIMTFNKSFAEDALTIKQQLDRITEEIKDLNKAVFNKSFDNENLNSLDESIDIERFTSIDIRIYDLEKSIKNLTLQFEEILFKLDDISNDMVDLESKLISKLEKSNIELSKENIENNKDTIEEDLEIEDKNTLGKIVITDNITEDDKESADVNIEIEKQNNSLLQKVSNLNPDEQLQYALDQMRKRNYNESKDILNQFIENFPENQLSGSAHFWLGKIYSFEKNYRKAALIFGDGVQKFPNSIKAPEMYYELAKSLKEMDKIPESCKTLTLLEQNYAGNKFTKDPEKIKDKLNCD
jgi:tol-pal system protein YbgF